MTDFITSIDFTILNFIQEHMTARFLDVFLAVFTFLGNGGAVWIAITIGLLITKKYRRLGIVMAISLVVCLITGNLGLKLIIGRERPFLQNTDFELIIPPPSGSSFPSGHSYSSFISAVILSQYSKKAALIALPAAALIAFSRLYFYVHFPSDVLCGILLGIIFGIIIFRLCKTRILQIEEQST